MHGQEALVVKVKQEQLAPPPYARDAPSGGQGRKGLRGGLQGRGVEGLYGQDLPAHDIRA